MSEDQLNNDSRPMIKVVEPDAHGQAALLLAESILHVLVDASVLTNAEAITVVVAACEVKTEVATAAGESVGRMQQSLDLLNAMCASFRADEAVQRPRTVPHFPRLA